MMEPGLLEITAADEQRGWIELPEVSLPADVGPLPAAVARHAREAFPLGWLVHDPREGIFAHVTSAYWHARTGIEVFTPGQWCGMRRAASEKWLPPRFPLEMLRGEPGWCMRAGQFGVPWQACVKAWCGMLETLGGPGFAGRVGAALTPRLVQHYLEHRRVLTGILEEKLRARGASESLVTFGPARVPSAGLVRRQRYRTQARAAYPHTLRLLRREGSSEQQGAVRRAIDAGEPLERVLAETCSVPAWVIRHAEQVGHSSFEAFRCLRQLTPEAAPKTAVGMQSLVELFQTFNACLRHPDKKDVAEIGAVIREGGVPELLDYLRFLEGLASRLGAHLGRKVSARRELGRPRFGEWVRLSRNWHRRFQAPEHPDEPSTTPALEWPPLLLEPATLHGWTITCLCNSAALEDEGRRMQHCVGRYVARCAARGTAILRAEKGEQAMTIEVEIQKRGGRQIFRITQARVVRNAAPSLDGTKLAARLCERLNLGALPINPAILEPVSSEQLAEALLWEPDHPADAVNALFPGGGAVESYLGLTGAGEGGLERVRAFLEISAGRGQLYKMVCDAVYAARRRGIVPMLGTDDMAGAHP